MKKILKLPPTVPFHCLHFFMAILSFPSVNENKVYLYCTSDSIQKRLEIT